MDSAIKSEEEKREYFDSPKVLDGKVEKLAQMIRESKYMCTFTGAGISTASGIPDYRSGASTKLKTGAGCWEKAANIAKAKKEGKLYNKPASFANFNVKINEAHPSKCHMAMVEMMNKGYLKHIISQNIDGLHRKSGIPASQLSELHGNVNLEKCDECGKDYMRDFKVRTAQKCHDHYTGRKCDNSSCKGKLYDTIINFGENLDDEVMRIGFEQGEKCDLMISMGSSLRVTPACDIVSDCEEMPHQKVVIINLQKTKMDAQADLVIHAMIDDVIELLMKKLNLNIPQFKLDRWAKIKLKQGKENKETLYVNGMDKLGGPFDLFKKLYINNRFGGEYPSKPEDKKENSFFEVAFFAQGHYREEKLMIKVPRKLLIDNNNVLKVNMICNPYKSGKWESVEAHGNKLEFVSVSETSKAGFNRSASTSATSSQRLSSPPAAVKKQPQVVPLPRGKSVIKKPTVTVPPKPPAKSSVIGKAGAQIMNSAKKANIMG